MNNERAVITVCRWLGVSKSMAESILAGGAVIEGNTYTAKVVDDKVEIYKDNRIIHRIGHI